MAKKLIDNGLFESSRFILPEHREGWLTLQEKLMVRKKPVLEDQELEQIRRTLIDSYNKRLRIRVMVFNPIDDEVYAGIVSAVNTYLKEIKIVWDKGEYKFIKIDKIISTSI